MRHCIYRKTSTKVPTKKNVTISRTRYQFLELQFCPWTFTVRHEQKVRIQLFIYDKKKICQNADMKKRGLENFKFNALFHEKSNKEKHFH